MDGEKMHAARQALDRFLFELLGTTTKCSSTASTTAPELVDGWTRDKRPDQRRSCARISRAAAPRCTTRSPRPCRWRSRAATARRRSSIISDGNDTEQPHRRRSSVKQLIRETEVLVYAIGIDSMTQSQPIATALVHRGIQQQPPRRRRSRSRSRRPAPTADAACRATRPPSAPSPIPAAAARAARTARDDRVNVRRAARHHRRQRRPHRDHLLAARSRSGATAGIADELSKQYYLGYSMRPARRTAAGTRSASRCENPTYSVRARRGYVATH